LNNEHTIIENQPNSSWSDDGTAEDSC
jgi:hypothetical protein